MHESYYTTKLLHEARQREMLRFVEQRNLRHIARQLAKAEGARQRYTIAAIVGSLIAHFRVQRSSALTTAELRALRQE